MMYLRWHGGYGYGESMPDERSSYEQVVDAEDAINTIERRANGMDSFYPGAHSENSGGGWLYAGSREPWAEEDPHPDSIIAFDETSIEWAEQPS